MVVKCDRCNKEFPYQCRLREHLSRKTKCKIIEKTNHVTDVVINIENTNYQGAVLVINNNIVEFPKNKDLYEVLISHDIYFLEDITINLEHNIRDQELPLYTTIMDIFKLKNIPALNNITINQNRTIQTTNNYYYGLKDATLTPILPCDKKYRELDI